MPIKFAFSTARPKSAAFHAVLLLAEETRKELDHDLLDAASFKARTGSSAHTRDAKGTVFVAGLGSAASLDEKALRRAATVVGRAAAGHATISIELPDISRMGEERVAAIVAEGILLGSYSYVAYRPTKKGSQLRSVSILGKGRPATRQALARALVVADAVFLARDLVNEPGGDLTPARFASIAKKVAREGRMKIKVLGLAELRKMKMGGILGVARGSKLPPRFVEMTYEPMGKTTGHLALIGKGITFDSGGLSIKTSAGMMAMKCDMGGAAAVLGAMSALPALAPATKVTALIPLSDNMLGGDATRPGDVLTIRNGKTVEVLNTDAEGRLVLADALSLATERKPDAAIDLATLTGACVVALGEEISGLMFNDQSWREQIEAASKRSGEMIWPLPLPDEYKSLIESSIADVKNIGGSWGGALTAGLFLKEFVDNNLPWAHLDIAGPAFRESANQDHPVGGTGYGVRLLIDLVENFRKP